MSQQKIFWFIVGSQHLYGPEALLQVEDNAKTIVNRINEHTEYPIVFKTVATTREEIVQVVKEANYNDEVMGIITWMHTFSPAKMWIAGTKLLQKPLLHFATQFNRSIPWETIDMDFMNLNQAAHGDREYGFINKRLGVNNKVIVGHYEDEQVIDQIKKWQQVAIGYHASNNVRVVRFGDNMRDVAVTEGDKVEAEIQFGWVVDYYGIGDLVAVMNEISDAEVDALFQKYQELYTFDLGDNSLEYFTKQVKEQARIELALLKFMKENNYNALTTNFQDLHGMKQLPGLAIQRLNSMGYGFAGEGDWKTAALSRVLKVMTNNTATGFMEDYTYELAPNQEQILQSHMLEVDPTLAVNKPRIVVSPLGIGGKEDPARLVFDGVSGDAVVISMIDLGTHYKLLINEVTLETPTIPAPKLPVARVIWKPKPNFKEGVARWIYAGGGHHTVVSVPLNTEQIIDLARLFKLDIELIK